MKRLIAVLVLMFSLVGQAQAVETYVDRARVILARLKDNASPLDSKIGVTEGLRYASPFVKAYMGNFPSIINIVDGEGNITGTKTFDDLTGEEKSTIFVESIKAHVLTLYVADEANTASESARTSALSTAGSQFVTDLGQINT